MHRNSSSVLVTPSNSREETSPRYRLPQQQRQHRRHPWFDRFMSSSSPLTDTEWDRICQEKTNAPFWNGTPSANNNNNGHHQGLVRWVGMIQDLLEPEYISIDDDNEEQKRSSSNGSSLLPTNNNLMERTPAILVSIPAMTSWYRHRMIGASSSSSSSSSVSSNNNTETESSAAGKKKNDDDDETMEGSSLNDDDLESRAQKRIKRDTACTTTTAMAAAATTTTTTALSTTSTTESNMMLVAHFYNEQYPTSCVPTHQPPPQQRLNQIVEILGFIDDVDPNSTLTDTTLGGGDNNGEQTNDTTTNHNNNDDDDDVMMDMQHEHKQEITLPYNDGMWQDEGNEEMMMSAPPHIPRLHVVWFRTITLDDEIEDSRRESSSSVVANKSIESSQDDKISDAMVLEAMSQYLAPHDIPNLDNNNNTSLVAQAIWMVLNSRAERNRMDPSMVVTTPQETVVGCTSLSIIVPPPQSPTATTKQPMVLSDRIITLLQQLVPVVQVLTVTLETLDSHIWTPSRQNGRIRQTAIQLAAGSVLVLDLRGLSSSSTSQLFSPQYLSPQQWSNWQAICDLCHQHRIHYTFDGGVRIPFEADYRIIVLCHADMYRTLPCTMTVSWNTFLTVADAPPEDGSQRLATIRDYLRYCHDASSCPTELSSNVLDRAQADFIQRRRRQSNEAAMAKVPPQPSEMDFHRWLTLTRCFARSRKMKTAHVGDWTDALALDDAMQSTLR